MSSSSGFPFLMPHKVRPAQQQRKKQRIAAPLGLTVGEVMVEHPCDRAVLRREALCWVDHLSTEQRAELRLQPAVSALSMTAPKSYPVFRDTAKGVGVPRFYGLRTFQGGAPPGRRNTPPASFPAFAGKLAERQTEAFDKALAALRSEEGGATLVLPCGFGKTVIALALCAALGRKALVLVHKECLLEQWAARIQQFLPGARVGKIQQTHVEAMGLTLDEASTDDLVTRIHGLGPQLAQRVVDGRPYGAQPSDDDLIRVGVRKQEMRDDLRRQFDGRDFHVVLGMLQSISMKRYDPTVLASFDLTVVDEAHHICAETFSKAMSKLPAHHVLGLSATPDRSDGLGRCLPWFLGAVAFRSERTYSDLVVQQHPYLPDDPKEMMTRTGKINMAGMVSRLVQDLRRQRLVRQIVLEAVQETPERYVMVLSERLELLRVLERQLRVLVTLRPPASPQEEAEVTAPEGLSPEDLQDPDETDGDALAWNRLVQEHLPAGTPVRWVREAPPGMPAIGQYVGGLRPEERQTAGACRIVLASYAMCSEGLDIPRLDTLVLATPRSQVEQSVGRILRLHPDKQLPTVYDIVDQYSVFKAMGWKRRHLYRQLGFRLQAPPTPSSGGAAK